MDTSQQKKAVVEAAMSRRVEMNNPSSLPDFGVIRRMTLTCKIEPMPKVDPLTFYTLNAMADDWESIAQVELQVNESHGRVTRQEILAVIRNLYADGYLRAMDGDGYSMSGYPEDEETAWFSMTNSGRKMFEENIVYYDE